MTEGHTNWLREEFHDPPATEYGNVPFWWWDGDELSEERITEQLETLSEKGVEAVCFEQKYPHGPPEGPQVPYFSEEWWNYMAHTVEECDRLGMSLWLHDLTYHHSPPSWKRYWQTRAEEQIDDSPELQGHVLDRVSEDIESGETAELELPAEFTPLSIAAYPVAGDGSLSIEDAVEEGADAEAVVDDASAADTGERLVEWTAPDSAGEEGDEWHVAAVGYRPEGLRRTRRDVVDWILDSHYGAYVERFGDSLGDPIVGTFQDELYVLQGSIPCDEQIVDRYRAEWDEDLTAKAIALFEDCGSETTALRARFYDVVVTMLEENWFRPLFEWHERRGLRFAHDNWGRNDLTEHATEYGDYVRTMRWFQEPGYDDGGRFEGVGTRNFFDAKLASSIASCYGRDRVWGELLHTTGWGFPLDLHFAAIAENACYGLNHYNKHGLYYATLGGWYEHAPPDTHFRQPYWEHAEAFNDAVTRLMYLCSQGDRAVDIAMLYPITSVQAHRLAGTEPVVDGPGGHYKPELEETAHEIDERTREISERLYTDVADLLFVDHETVRDGAVANGRFAFGGQEADVFVLGPVTTVRREVLETAAQLVEDGGTVVSVGQLPTATVEGGEDDPALAAFRELVFEDTGTAAADLTAPAVTEHESGGVAIHTAAVDDLVSVIDEHVSLDVRGPDDVYHAHRSVGDYDSYLLLNTRDEARTVELDLRATGRPERWNVHDGVVEPIHVFEQGGRYTTLELEFAPHEFQVIGFDSAGGETGDTSVVETSLSAVDDVTTTDGVGVSGRVDESGTHDVTAAIGNERLEGVSDPVSVPEPVDLDESWEFDLDPTMRNHRGDFRYPASDELIGPEIRAFEHRAEGNDEDGVDEGWTDPDATRIDAEWDLIEGEGGMIAEWRDPIETGDSDWTSTRWSYGQQFWRRSDGPETAAVSTPEADPGNWEPYHFSTLVGKPGTHPDDHGFNGVVSEDFLVAPAGDGPAHFWTTVHSDAEERVACHVGSEVRHLVIGETDAVDATGATDAIEDADGPVEVTLPAGTTPVHVVVEPDSRTHVAIEPLPAEAHQQGMDYVPRLRWFHGVDAFEFEPRPWEDDGVDWYRFEVPVGTTAFTLPVAGDRRVWVDGEEVTVTDEPECRVELETPRLEPTIVTIRSTGDSTGRGGRRWTGPVAIETTPVTVDTGDWCDLGLTEYSGIGVYRKTVDVPAVEDDDRVVLDLGDVGVSASVAVDGEPVGTVFAAPYEVDITDALERDQDECQLEVRVANTIANHFATETPTRYVYDGQRRSGLFGPVSLRVERGVTVDLGP